jgi:hypothetical protein
MNNDRRCRQCGKPLVRRDGECVSDWRERKSCNRSCHVAWNNAKPIWLTFTEKTEPRDSGCIEWTGHRDPKGYGRFSSQGGEILVHRLAYTMHFGVDPGELHVLHSCDNPSCCNPHHLFLGTNADNMADRLAKGRQARLFGDANPNYRHGRNCAEKAA